MLARMAWLAHVQGDDNLAVERYRVSFAIERTLTASWGLPTSLEGLAEVELTRGRLERQAGQLLGAGAALRQAVDGVLPPSQRAELDEGVAAVRTRLSEVAFMEAWAEGQAMKREQAIAYALQEKPDGQRTHAE